MIYSHTNFSLEMTSATPSHVLDKISFPTWKELFVSIIHDFCAQKNVESACYIRAANESFKLLGSMRPQLQENCLKFIPSVAYTQMAGLCSKPEYLDDIKPLHLDFGSIKFGVNEFYSVFDIRENDHVIVDPRIEEVLGIRPSQFSFRALSGADPDSPLFHPEDLNHAVRSAIVCYFMVNFPGFEWVAHRDFYRARFRVSTAHSSLQELRDLEYVMLEKRSYMLVDQMTGKGNSPMRHLNRWTVYEPHEFNGIQPYLSSTPFQTKFRNLMFYVLNAHLVGLSVKSVYLLNQRIQYDRNKSIANHVNEQIAHYHSLRYEFTENQIGDAFAKTIRGNVAQAVRYWEGLETKPEVQSDLDALHYAKRLCLVPMPPLLQDLIVQNVCIGD